MSDSWKQIRVEQLTELERKSAALDWLLAHRKWLSDHSARLRLLYAEDVLEAIESAMKAEGKP